MDRTKESFDIFYEKNKDLEQSEYLDLLSENFGDPPYEFLDETQLPKKIVKRKKSLTLSPAYKAKYPQPNYHNFSKPEYRDTKGREYKLATGFVKQRLVDQGDITQPKFTVPDLYEHQFHGTQVFWVRIPVSRSKKFEIPDVNSNEKVELYHYFNTTKCTGTVESCFFGPRRKTGYIILRDFTSYGSETDPREYDKAISL
jgi:hypothetical protein